MNFDDSFFEDLCSNTKEKKKQHPYSVRRQEFRVSKNCKIQQTSILKTTMGTQPLWTSSIKFEPLRKKYQSADTNTHVCLTPQKKRKDQRMLMHTTPRKRLF
jgi:hypothetical protein